MVVIIEYRRKAKGRLSLSTTSYAYGSREETVEPGTATGLVSATSRRCRNYITFVISVINYLALPRIWVIFITVSKIRFHQIDARTSFAL